MKCHAISLPIQSCLWKRAKMMKDSMNKMIKRIKGDSDMFVFWWIRKKETKKNDTKVCMKD
jgi:O-glycosyl hydrolase